MGSATEPLPSEVTRIFVGNLVPSITDVALLRLFSRFGDTSQFERNCQKGYAHLSLKPKDTGGSNDTERCISSLNRTTWCGTTLRVEHANEHFLTRLKREWDEERGQTCDSTKNTENSPSNHFENFKKGKHTKFSFPDLEPAKTGLESQKEDQPKSLKSTLPSTAPIQNESDANLNQADVSLNPSSSKSMKLDSTLALFGLSSTSAVAPPQTNEGGNVKKRPQPQRERSPAKRARSPIGIESRGDEVTQTPPLSDIGSEKQTANVVLQKLLRESQTTSHSTSFKRLGLYRKLLQLPLRGPNTESSNDQHRARRETGVYDHIAEPSRPSKSASGGSRATSFHRAGLYRMIDS